MKLNDVVYVSFHMLGHLSAWRANYFDSSVLFYARCWGRIYPHGPTLNFDFAHSPNQSKTTCFAMQDRGGLQVIEELRAEKEAMKKTKAADHGGNQRTFDRDHYKPQVGGRSAGTGGLDPRAYSSAA